MILYLVRHAQSRNNALWLATSSHKNRVPDPLLSDTGRQQARHLAEFVKSGRESESELWSPSDGRQGFGITHLYSSLMLRAVETGLMVSKTTGVPLNGWIDIHETGGIVSGDGEEIPFEGQPGSTESYLRREYPDLMFTGQFGEQGWWNRPREDEAEKRPRAHRVVQTLLEKHGHSEDRVLMITHGSFYIHLMREMMGIHDTNVYFELSNTGITRWEVYPNRRDSSQWVRMLVYMNRTDHLPPELVTI